MHSKKASRFMIRLSVQLLAVLASMTVATAHAKSSKQKSKKAAAVFAASTAAVATPEPGVNLKFDGGLADSALAEDCEDGSALIVSAYPTYPALPTLAKNLQADSPPGRIQNDIAPAVVTAAPKSSATSPLPLPTRTASLTVAPVAPVLPASQPMIPRADQAWDIVPTDKTLNAALARWASVAGWQLMWELPVDYAVEARTTVPGNFEEAVSTVAKSMETAEIPMKAIFYQGNKVLRIVVKGSE